MKKKTIRITEDQIIKRQTQKALAEGRLYEECLKHYPADVVEKLCPACDYCELCVEQRRKKVTPVKI